MRSSALLLLFLVSSPAFAQPAAEWRRAEDGPLPIASSAQAVREAYQQIAKPEDGETRARELRRRDKSKDGEFFFYEVQGQQAGKHAFLMRHAQQQALPQALDLASLAEASSQAWIAFQRVKFRGIDKSRASRWRALGPDTVSDSTFAEPKNISGRVTDLAIRPDCDYERCRLYVGTAGGGLWRSDHALHPTRPRWQLLTNGLDSNNIGAIMIDPNDGSGNTLYVGTGETNYPFTSAAGKGLFRSTDGGDQFTRVPTEILDPVVSPEPIDFTATRGISQVAVHPGDPDTIWVSTTIAMLGMTAVRGGQSSVTGRPQARVGLYRTTDGGQNWELVFVAPINTYSSPNTHEGAFQLISGVKDIQFDPQNADIVYISVADDGLYRSAPAIDGDAQFHKVFGVVGSSTADAYVAFDMTIKDGNTRIYAYNGNSSDQEAQGLYRLDDASLPNSSLWTGAANSGQWLNLSTFNNPQDFVDFEICRGQCVYDLVVATPDGRPDTVYIGGVATRSLGDSTIRSVDGGQNFLSHSIDRAPEPGIPHVDVRAIVFAPANPNLAFIGSDGGVVRTNGGFGPAIDRCTSVLGIASDDMTLMPICQAALIAVPQEFTFMNAGLQTMQFFNISADPNNPLGRIMAGTQDNSTQWFDGTGPIKQWSKVFDIGDGTSANGFHRGNASILFASFQTTFFFTHFNGGVGGNANWLYTGGPIQFSDERQYPNAEPGTGRQFITFDPLDADTQFTGYEHIWRTRNNGGSEADLLANGCAFGGDFLKAQCGDWEPLGPYLPRFEFGFDRQGGVIVAAERSAGDGGTLWAGTSLGRLFITENVDAAAGSVDFERLDQPSTPPRFISGIAVDSDQPRRAFIAYSGFSAVTPDAPGHVFEVVFDGAVATISNLDYNLGDMPVNHLVRDDLSGDLYAATDFGVLMLPNGATAWEIAGAGLPTVLTPHLEIHPEQRLLFVATHGMGGWYLPLDKD